MDIDSLNKEDLIKYKKLLQELKNQKIYRNVSISLASLSTIGFIYFGRSIELKQLVINAIILAISLNAISYNSKEINNIKTKIKKMEE